MPRFSRYLVPVQIAVLLSAALIQFAIKEIDIALLPKPVCEAIDATIPGATWVRVRSEMVDGRKLHEVTVRRGGRIFDVTVTPNGHVVETEKSINANDLPPEVSKALKSHHPRATIRVAEEVCRDNQVIGYEVECWTGKNIVKVLYDPQGMQIDARAE